MNTIDQILRETIHRPYLFPERNWAFYQEWNKVLFLHWEIEPEIIAELLPKNIDLDLFNGKAWISVVAFTMEKIRPKSLPAFPPVSDFHEINVRTYVTKGGKSGVYFVNIEAQKLISVLIAKGISGLPYEKSKITRDNQSELKKYTSSNKSKGFSLRTEYSIGENIHAKTELDRWLTERYCLYLEKNHKLIRYEIHHKEWEIEEVDLTHLDIRYPFNEHLNIHTSPVLAHYSKGVQVIAWGKEYLN